MLAHERRRGSSLPISSSPSTMSFRLIGSFLARLEERLDRLHVDVDLALVVDDAAAPHAAFADRRARTAARSTRRADRPAARRGGRRRAASACRARASTRRRPRGDPRSATSRRGRRRARCELRDEVLGVLLDVGLVARVARDRRGSSPTPSSSSTKRARRRRCTRARLPSWRPYLTASLREERERFAERLPRAAELRRGRRARRRRARPRSGDNPCSDERAAAASRPVPTARAPRAARSARRPARLRASSLSCSSRTRRSAVFLPTPGMAVSFPRSPCAIARASSSAGSALSTAIAVFGPTLETPMSVRNAEPVASRSRTRRATSASSRTCVWTKSVDAAVVAAARGRRVPSGTMSS